MQFLATESFYTKSAYFFIDHQPRPLSCLGL